MNVEPGSSVMTLEKLHVYGYVNVTWVPIVAGGPAAIRYPRSSTRAKLPQPVPLALNVKTKPDVDTDGGFEIVHCVTPALVK